MESKLYDLELKPSKFIKTVSIFPVYEKSDTHHLFLINTQEEFVKAIWYMVKRHGISPSPQGCGTWTGYDECAIRGFFEYKEYRLYIEGIKEFKGKDKYIMQYIYDEYRPKIHITSLSVIVENYKKFIEQFDDNYKDESLLVRLY